MRIRGNAVLQHESVHTGAINSSRNLVALVVCRAPAIAAAWHDQHCSQGLSVRIITVAPLAQEDIQRRLKNSPV